MNNTKQYPDKMYVSINNKEDFNKAIRFGMKHISARSNSGHFLSKYWAKQMYSENVKYVMFTWSDRLESYITNICSDDNTNKDTITSEYNSINNILNELKI